MEHDSHHKGQTHYGRLAIELTLDFIVMYLVMYTMIAALAHFRFNLNNVYMTMMMVAPMTIIMLVSMRSMFPSQRLNMIIGGVAVAVFVFGFVAMRTQAGIGNAEFLRSMIPHHSGAILMCEKASITDPEILALCQEITKSQSQEITQMEAILARQR
jgi:uncharacterized protein (DUF305 family)